MKRSVLLAAGVGLALFFSPSVRAADPFVKAEVAEMARDFGDSRLSAKLFEALGELLAAASDRLRSEGHAELASQIQSEWTSVLAANSMNFGTLDLGDHRPLNDWLAKTYDQVEAALGKRLVRWLRFDDLKVLNYAIPVVFHPRGFAGESWDRVEYAKHFVPFSGAVAYWSVNGACRLSTTGLWSFACSLVSEVPRFAVEEWIAPELSDRVYLAANGRRVRTRSVDPLKIDALIDQAEVILMENSSGN